MLASVIKKPNALTVRKLQDSYDLNTDAMPVGDDGFNMIPEILEIDANTLTFAPTFVGMGPFTLARNTLMLIDGIGEDVETCVFTRRAGAGTSNEVTEGNL